MEEGSTEAKSQSAKPVSSVEVVTRETVMNLVRQLFKRTRDTDECIDVADARSRTFKYDAKNECDMDEVGTLFNLCVRNKTRSIFRDGSLRREP